MLGSGALKLLDGHLAGRDWIVGEGVTIADISAFGVVAFAGDAGFELSPHVAAWAERMRALPGFGTPEELLGRRTQDAA
jgi:glutathione S-transferase